MAQKSVYVRFQVPKEAVDKTYQILQVAKDTGKLRKGTNESTKAIERGIAKLVVIAEDVERGHSLSPSFVACPGRILRRSSFLSRSFRRQKCWRLVPLRVLVPRRSRGAESVPLDGEGLSACSRVSGDSCL